MNILEKAKQFARKKYSANDTLHQWSHIEAVLKRSEEIAAHYKAIDREALGLAIIFHDIDYSSYESHVENSVKVAHQFLVDNNYPQDKIKKIQEIIFNHSTPHREKFGDARLIEGKIIYDVDKSLFINKENYSKYYPKLYLPETKEIIKNVVGG